MKLTHLTIIVAASAGLICAGASKAVAQNDEQGAHGSVVKKEKGPSGSKVVGFNGIETAKEISKEEAAKSYPPPRGGYPPAENTQGVNTGFSQTVVTSPYPPHHRFDTSGINRGGLILDPYAKHVFVKP